MSGMGLHVDAREALADEFPASHVSPATGCTCYTQQQMHSLRLISCTPLHLQDRPHLLLPCLLRVPGFAGCTADTANCWACSIHAIFPSLADVFTARHAQGGLDYDAFERVMLSAEPEPIAQLSSEGSSPDLAPGPVAQSSSGKLT